MGHEVTIGGERLGSGKKMKAYLHNYERSTHDLGYVWRSTMSAGTLVPFMVEVALPGDTFDIDLNCDILTHPTIGPLFGSYKVQLDVFQIPIRLYQGKLHMNMLGIGMDMSKVPLPQLTMSSGGIDPTKPIDNQQINPSSIFSYLGIRGVGYTEATPDGAVSRQFNAVPYLAYWDIYKNYYANKQEEVGVVIHKDVSPIVVSLTSARMLGSWPALATIPVVSTPPLTYQVTALQPDTQLDIFGSATGSNIDLQSFLIAIRDPQTQIETVVKVLDLFNSIEPYPGAGFVQALQPKEPGRVIEIAYVSYIDTIANENTDTAPSLVEFPLENIDTMRQTLLSWFSDTGFPIDGSSPAPYGLPFQSASQVNTAVWWSKLFSQEGLAIKTYQSDLLNNWISTDWIDGPDGISAITAVDVSGGTLVIDELNMSKKIYDMLNRIAISGGTYDDWLDAVYTHERTRSAENPIYLGGLIRNLVFQEVVSQTNTPSQPLGTLAGRGTMGDKKKGGQITAKIDEPSYLMGIISITPHVDYSQGNKWDTNLKTMNDLHKPALDEIGFQDLVTDQAAWFDTAITSLVPTFKSAGKQPAWINYMTNVNQVRGNFADELQQMFMVLNRRYTANYTAGKPFIADLTTYIDPAKFNHIFADTARDAQNFWAQVGVNIEARRKMSAKVMPNL